MTPHQKDQEDQDCEPKVIMVCTSHDASKIRSLQLGYGERLYPYLAHKPFITRYYLKAVTVDQPNGRVLADCSRNSHPQLRSLSREPSETLWQYSPHLGLKSANRLVETRRADSSGHTDDEHLCGL
jgi:hypothetical protein